MRVGGSPWKLAADGATVTTGGGVLNLPAICVALLVTWICYIGIRQSAFVNTLVVIIKVAIVLAVIGFGAFYVNPSNWHPFIPPNTGTFGVYGWSGVLRAAGIVFFAYIGFDAVSTAAQEAKNPARNMPIGILGSLLICTVLYILMSGVLTGLLPYPLLNDAAPVAVALAAHPQLAWLRTWVIIGALAGLTSVILVMMLAQARIFLAMARHGLLPAVSRQGPPAVPHAARRDADHRRLCRHCRRPAAGGPARRAGLHRHPDRLHRGVHRRAGAAQDATRSAAPVPRQGCVVRGTRRRRDVRADDRLPAGEHLAAAGAVDGDRRGDLFRLQLQAQPAAQLIGRAGI